MATDTRVERCARLLEGAVLAVAAGGILFRLTWYGRLPKAAGANYGTGDVIDFGLTLLLFLLATLCAACGVALSMRSAAGQTHPGRAYRPLLIGITTFVAYYFLAPHLPSWA